MNSTTPQEAEVIVVGGGLAGLTAATYLGRAGRSVVLFERSRCVGGRAVTEEQSDFRFNLGPHALYRGGAGVGILRELGVPIRGGVPPTAGHVVHRGRLRGLPASPWSLLTTDLFGYSAKLEAARMLVSIRGIDASLSSHLSLQAWVETSVHQPEVRDLFYAIARLSTYANDPERLSADVALGQIQLGLKGVYYLDHGWQTLVDGLRAAAQTAGVKIMTGQRVAAIEVVDESARGVRLENDAVCLAPAVVIAATPAVASALVNGHIGKQACVSADAPIAVKAATFDVGLSRLPQPRVRFALGIDRPLYYSVHSAVAKLAPEGGAMIHAMKYLSSEEQAHPTAVNRELEELLDLVQPGWRDVVVERRFLPDLTVVSALATAARGGLSGRPGAESSAIGNLYLAGDWVGPEGWLCDASLASAKRSAECIVEGCLRDR